MIVLPAPGWGRFLVLVALAGVAGCGSGGGGSSGLGSGMSIQSCSLSCSDSAGSPGAQVSCGVTNVKVNQEVRVTFSSAVDPVSVTNNTFQMVELGTGKTPAGTFALDSNDPRVLIYRPQLTFDSTGNPIFGLNEGRSYQLKIPGVVLDPLGPHIRNLIGTPNTSRLQCTLVAAGIADPKPGRPRVTITVDVVTGYDANGEPNAFAFNRPAQNATNVYRASAVRMVFDDVMNPATLANPVTSSSSFIRAFVDADGNLSTSSDRVRIAGTFSVTIDQASLRTTVIFTPSGGLPSSGADPLNLRRTVIDLSAQIADIGGQLLVNPGTTSFTSEQIPQDLLVVTEQFPDDSGQDAARSGDAWGNGVLTPGVGGGSGRLGDLIVAPGAIVELDTDSEDFSGLELEAFNPVNVIDRPANLVITDGTFEFARLRVDSGGVLRFKGSKPARLFVRGEAQISGVIDVSGGSGRLQRSDSLPGGEGGAAGPSGGAGGRGGSRPDGLAFIGVFNNVPIGGVPNPGVGPSNVLDPATYVFVNGENGGGVLYPSTIAPGATLRGGGEGALAWPQPTAANPNVHMPQNQTDVAGLQAEKAQLCQYLLAAASGGGGSNAIRGGVGEAIPFLPPTDPTTTLAPTAPGGADLLVGDPERTLSPDLGFLRGGGGGGGGGAHLQLTQVHGLPTIDCSIPLSGGVVAVKSYVAHSAAGGGGGGGGLELVAGRRILQGGVIDASGGDGGSGTFPPRAGAPSDLAMGGGGGAGGGILLESSVIQISGIPNRINFSGGTGGDGSGRAFAPVVPAHGGRGSPGLLRMETITPVVRSVELTKISPTAEDLSSQYGGAITMEEIFTIDTWDPPATGPAGWSGAQSCWIRPDGSFFRLLFADDSVGLGWDMHLGIVGQATPQSFRGPNDLFPVPLEQVLGADFGTSPVIVRFQGARVAGALADPCGVPESGAQSPLAGGSLSEWVRHPSELTDFYGQEELTPNMFRFVILWDRSQVEFGQIESIEDLTVTIQPD